MVNLSTSGRPTDPGSCESSPRNINITAALSIYWYGKKKNVTVSTWETFTLFCPRCRAGEGLGLRSIAVLGTGWSGTWES